MKKLFKNVIIVLAMVLFDALFIDACYFWPIYYWEDLVGIVMTILSSWAVLKWCGVVGYFVELLDKFEGKILRKRESA